MATTKQDERRKSSRGQSRRRTGTIEIKRIAGEGDKGRAVTVGHEIAPKKKDRSIWSWHEEFAVAWSATFITKKKKRNQKEGE